MEKNGGGCLVRILGSLALIAGSAIPSLGEAATLYVSTAGANSSSCGSASAPCRTISYTVSNRISGGDEIVVRGGTYNEVVNITAGGSASAPTWLHAYNGEKVLIDGTGVSTSEGLINAYASYVRIEGFEIANAFPKGHGITSYNVHHIQVINNIVHDTYSTGIWLGQDFGGANCHDTLVQGNTVYRTVQMNSASPGSSGGGWGQGISLSCVGSYSTNLNQQAIGNIVFNNWGEGIGAQKSNGAVISGNIVFDNFSVGIYPEGAENVVVDHNLVYFTGDSRFLDSKRGTGPIGIGLSIEAGGGYLDNNVITNNIVIGTEDGIRYFIDADPKGMVNNLIANNTVINCRSSDLYIGENANHSGNKIVNNIFYGSRSGILSKGSPSGFTFDHNAWYGGSVGPFQGGSADVTLDPKLVNPNATLVAGGVSAANYTLQSTSPLAAAGRSLAQVTKDYFGTPRVGSFSIGAHQPTSPTATPTPTPAPTPTPTPAPTAPTAPAASPTPVPSSTNLVQNPGFEQGLTAWTQDWGNSKLVSRTKASGSYGLRVGSGAGGRAQFITGLVPGATYTMTVYAKVSSSSVADCYVGVNLRTQTGAKIGGDIGARVTGSEWTKYTFRFVAPANASALTIWAYKDTSASGYLFADQFSLVKN